MNDLGHDLREREITLDERRKKIPSKLDKRRNIRTYLSPSCKNKRNAFFRCVSTKKGSDSYDVSTVQAKVAKARCV